MVSIPAEILARIMYLVGHEVNQREFVSKMMYCHTMTGDIFLHNGPILLHTAHDGHLNDGLIELLITGPGFEGKAKFEPKSDKLREVVIKAEPSVYKGMFSYGKKIGSEGGYWESKFLSSKAKLKSGGFYERVWVLTVLFDNPHVKILEFHKDSGVQRKG